MKVMVGGTFDMLHIGHQALLKCAFKTAGNDGYVIIGLSSDTFAARKHHPVQNYETRKNELIGWISQCSFPAQYSIEPLHNPFGSAIAMDFDILVVSYETYHGGELINQKRIEAGLKPVRLEQVSCVYDDDGEAVSSTRIYEGKIDKLGHSKEKILK